MMKYIYFVGILMIAACSLSSIAMAARDVEIALEAELANEIVAPMVIAVPEEAKKQGGPEPDEPSSGKFIWVPGPPASGGNDHQGYAEFIIDIPQKDTYAVWGWVIAWDGNSDSFWVTWTPADPDPSDPKQDPQKTQDTHYRWAVQQGPTWHWDRINQWLDGGTFDREWELDKGETKLRIGCRESATMLDCLFITNNLAADAGSVDPRLPTEDDINLQVHGAKGKAVNAAGKLSTTWGRIRSEYCY